MNFILVYKNMLRIASLVVCLTCISSAFAANADSVTLKSPYKKAIDLTHVLGPGMPDFHQGGEAFHYKKIFSVEKDGYANGSFSTIEHYGTHVDAPSHFFVGKASIDQIPVEDLILPCVVIDVRQEVNSDPDYRLTMEKIRQFERAGSIPSHSAVLLLTGWSQKWDSSADYRNADNKGTMHFPGFDKDSAEYLVNKSGVACLGIDTLSIDAGTSDVYSAHKAALGKGLFLIENLKNLELLPERGAWCIVAPLLLKDGTGSPSRVYALKP